ncbi:hypothetical protein [Moorena sp. SIO4A5]|uniref:hypothetical protein n=1 Tax=Moorena sp. SIO4A5 TaxID=2607838 RepID=UPI0013C810AD|nr:hypothetical protein [Moorena sp. SIO4A5]NEO23353.1 hypothetical protein [Moorena sp. SIO4A5]
MTIPDQLKNISVIEHTRHHSPVNFLINLLGGLIAYCQSAQKAFPLPRTGITWFRLTKTDVSLMRYTGFFPCSLIRSSLFSVTCSGDPLFPVP